MAWTKSHLEMIFQHFKNLVWAHLYSHLEINLKHFLDGTSLLYTCIQTTLQETILSVHVIADKVCIYIDLLVFALFFTLYNVVLLGFIGSIIQILEGLCTYFILRHHQHQFLLPANSSLYMTVECGVYFQFKFIGRYFSCAKNVAW